MVLFDQQHFLFVNSITLFLHILRLCYKMIVYFVARKRFLDIGNILCLATKNNPERTGGKVHKPKEI